MKKHIIWVCSLFFATFAMQSCLDFDDPGSELGVSSTTMDTEHYVGNVDHIPYLEHPTKTGVEKAVTILNKNLSQILTGQYNMRGGKEGGTPAAHAYQRQYSLGPDLYAQYFVLPHKDFMYGTQTSTYNVSAEFNNGPLGAYTMAKNAFMPLLHHPMVDSIPEIKAITLLYYCVIAQEQADLSGPFTYIEDKQNSESPYEYNDLRTIYYGIVENLDTIVKCLNNFQTRESWYKEEIKKIVKKYTDTNPYEDGTTLESFVRLANSLKLRMAMHIVKVEPETAKKWAKEAIESGVIEKIQDQHGVYPRSGFNHPFIEMATWNDLVLCASFESILMSLKHPYAEYLFLKNNADIKNVKTGEITPANTRLCGLSAGVLVGDGQGLAQNTRQAYSKYDSQIFAGQRPPLYFIKWAEVDFLRAEAALRWGGEFGDPESFYNSGIDHAYLEDPQREQRSVYVRLLPEYKKVEEAVEYTSVDPIGDRPDWKSVTKIGVAWGDKTEDKNIKLEKIITQKYIALFPLSTEAWTEMRRTGYPKVFPVLNADDGDGSIMQGDMIRRIPWVPTDPIAVEMVETSGIPALGGPDEQATRLWWDVDAPNF